MRGPRSPYLLIGLFTLAGLALRLPLIGDALFGDELGTFYSSVGHGPIKTIQIIGSEQEVTPPLYFVLGWLTQQLGDPTVTLRLVPLLCGTALIPLTYVVGLRTVGRPAAILAAALMAVAPFAIFYSTEARAYSLAAFLGLLSTLALLEAIDTGRARYWAAYALLGLGVVYSHYTVAFVLLAQFAWAWFAHPERRRPMFAAHLAIAVGFLPWFSQFLEDGRSPCAKIIEIGHPLGFATFWRDLVHLWIGHPFYDLDGPLGSVPGGAALAVCAAGAVLAAVGALLAGRRRPGSRTLLLVAIAATPALVAIYSAVASNSIYAPRNLIGSLPALALVVAAVVAAVRVVALRVAAAALLIGASAAGAVRMLESQNRRPDYDGAARFIAAAGGPRDVVINVDPYIGPGPYAPLDVQLMREGRTGEPRLNVGAPEPDYLIAEHAKLGAAPCDSQFAPPDSVATVAAKAARLGAGHRVFILTPGDLSFAALRAQVASGPAQLLGALAPDFVTVRARVFRGLGGVKMSVYELRSRRASPS